GSTIGIGVESWELYVVDTSLVGDAWCLDMTLIGLESHTVRVRLAAEGHPVNRSAVIDAVSTWLGANAHRTTGVVDLTSAA
ncbi:MAG: hypothetical protein QOJ79_4, partial [Actinomycetota bacterium]|nr:hypothetical protein [Actinomycetota bacterium]